MKRIFYFEKNIIDTNSTAYKFYKDLYLSKVIDSMVVFCDTNTTINSIETPVFHTYYLWEYFHPKIVICDKNNLQWIVDHIDDCILVIYDSAIEQLPKYTRSNIVYYDISDINNNLDIKKIIYE